MSFESKKRKAKNSYLHNGADKMDGKLKLAEQSLKGISMEIKEIRAITGLTQRQFAEKYHIPFGTYQKWEVPIESINHRECPLYVKELLERAVREDFQYKDKN